MAHARPKYHAANLLNIARNERRYIRRRSLTNEKRAAHRQERANALAFVNEALDSWTGA